MIRIGPDQIADSHLKITGLGDFKKKDFLLTDPAMSHKFSDITRVLHFSQTESRRVVSLPMGSNRGISHLQARCLGRGALREFADELDLKFKGGCGAGPNVSVGRWERP